MEYNQYTLEQLQELIKIKMRLGIWMEIKQNLNSLDSKEFLSMIRELRKRGFYVNILFDERTVIFERLPILTTLSNKPSKFEESFGKDLR
jgi:hypothetical protein